MRGVTRVHQQAPGVAGEHEHVVARAGDERDAVGEFRARRGCLRQRRAGNVSAAAPANACRN